MSKPLEQMTAKEMEERLLELDVEEHELWKDMGELRCEKSKVTLALWQLKEKGKKP